MSKRTSYVVFAREQPTFHNHLIISFDLSLWDNDHLGYVFNIIDNRNNSYSLTYIFNHNGSPTLNFNIDSKSNKIEIPLEAAQLKKRKWFKVKADINLTANTVSVLVNGKWYRAKGFAFQDQITPRITFGKNPHYSDVPNMAIKNLAISDDSEKHFFPLDEWKGTAVHDSDGKIQGFVDHPSWLINDSYFWTPKFQRTFNEVAGLNFDVNQQSLFVFKTDSVIRYNMQTDNVSGKPYQNKLPVKLLLGKSIVNTIQNKCYVYEVLPPDTMHSIASLDLNTLTWEYIGKGPLKEQRHHHNIFHDKAQGNFYLFGGYGSFSYHNDFFKYEQLNDRWVKIPFKGDTILPRFFSGSSQADEQNNVYIFGGYGNESGNQIVGGRHFYDLYRVNLTTHTIKKLWEIKPGEEPFVSANNLIISADKKYFYALCYPHEKPKTNLRLYKFSMQDGSYQVVSGTIPVTSERIESDFNLFYNTGQGEFICTAQEFVSPERSTIRIYTLVSPPVSEQVYLSSQRPAEAGLNRLYVYLIIAIVLVITALALWYIIRRRKKQVPEVISDDDLQPGFYNQKKEPDSKPNAVYLLGEFTAYNKAGKNITYLFSPKIKQLFILILLNSKDGHGVVSKKISTTLWPEKDIIKTKNIRGVTINHLRNIVSDIDGLELAFTNDTYRFIINDNFFCDYFEITGAIHCIREHQLIPEQFLTDQFDLFARGGLLHDVPEPWLDEVKVEFEEILLELLQPGIKKIYEAGEYRRALELSRVALAIDPFNDIALKYKLKSLRRFKGVDFAKKVYEEFTADYKKSLDSEYPVHFDKICK
ncbi:MAG: hypothetical protein WC743_11515 [Mucilaginibacter sp.]